MSSGFITETELAEAKKKRQEEWEKVRTPDQPLELPEEPYDGRSLYERLKEQKMKKELEYEEAHKLKNLIRGLDDDEVQFLDLVDRTKMKAEKQQLIEEQNELKDFRERVATLQEKSVEKKIQSEISKTKPKSTLTTARTSQRLLLGAVLKKRKNGEMVENGELLENSTLPKKIQKEDETSGKRTTNSECIPVEPNNTASKLDRGVMKCIGILPGIGRYKESSDSETSSDSEDEVAPAGMYDLAGRDNIIRKKKCEESEE